MLGAATRLSNHGSLGCVWIKDLVGEKEKEMEKEKVDDPMVLNGWII